MAEFAGYNMPISYSGIIDGAPRCKRNRVGIFDVSHMGEFIVKRETGVGFGTSHQFQ